VDMPEHPARHNCRQSPGTGVAYVLNQHTAEGTTAPATKVRGSLPIMEGVFRMSDANRSANRILVQTTAPLPSAALPVVSTEASDPPMIGSASVARDLAVHLQVALDILLHGER
jgi:hypothetical protein